MNTQKSAWVRRGVLAVCLAVTLAAWFAIVHAWETVLGVCAQWWSGVLHRPLLGAVSAVFLMLFLLAVIRVVAVLYREMHEERRWQTWLVAHVAVPLRGEPGVLLVHSARYFVFTKGFFRPTTYCSTTFLTSSPSQESSAVLAHEAWHRIRHDPLRAFLWRVTGAAMFFLPLVHLFRRHALTDLECAADGAALAAGHSRIALFAALERAVRSGGTLPVDVHIGFAVRANLLDRCHALVGGKIHHSTPIQAVIASAFLLIFFAIGAFVVPTTPAAAKEGTGACNGSTSQSVPQTPLWLTPSPQPQVQEATFSHYSP